MKAKVKLPVIPSIHSDQDIITALNNLRAFFQDLQANGGVISVKDLVATGLVNDQLERK